MNLNDRFQTPGVTFREANGFTFIDVENRHAKASLCTHGAHILSYVPAGEPPVLWLSEHAVFQPDKAIRGGIPICWPWFGSHPTDASLPSHGFARTAEWQVVDVTGSHEATEITLELIDTPETRSLWNWQFRLQLHVCIDSSLTVSLTTENCESRPMDITQALHSYFTVSNIADVSVTGLDDTDFLDQVGETERKRQSGAITFSGEVDRDYLGTQSDCRIHDSGFDRRITISKRGSNSTVVWNPWIDKGAQMADFGDDDYLTMLCVETTNATEFDRVIVEPGHTHVIAATLSVN